MIKLSAIQMSSGEDVKNNLATAKTLIQKAADLGAKLIVLPENFALMSENTFAKVKIKEPLGRGPIQDFLHDAAMKYRVFIAGGSIPIQSENENKVYATMIVFDDQGEMIAHYKKIHLFDVKVNAEQYAESTTIIPGDSIVVVDLPFARVGLSICYDVRFPELYRAMQKKEVEVILIAAAFTAQTGKAHWEVLTRARAIENLSYVVAAGQVGVHPGGRRTYGHSMIIDHWGDIVARLDAEPGVVIADFDQKAMHALRGTFPVLHHRKI